MSRTADYAIQGFIYQFVSTLDSVLQSPTDAKTIIEGPIEDIDIITPKGITAIQCKYHEAKEKFTLSSIYKPVLQMLNHYNLSALKNVNYKLYAHFPNETVGNKKKLTTGDIAQILSSTAKENKKLIADLTGFSDVTGFISKFEIEFGASLSDLEKAVVVNLSKEGFSSEDCEDIFFPNAIHMIAKYSIKHNISEREINKTDFIAVLKQKKSTAITRWTKELTSFEKLLKKRRDQMRTSLNKNLRNRAIILDPNYVKDFDAKFIQFAEDFIGKFNSKIKLHSAPTFCLITDDKVINEVWKRLNLKNVSVERGLIAQEFNVKHFIREPLKSIGEGKTEFKIRLCSEDDFKEVITKCSFDDIYIISDKEIDFLTSITDTTVEQIETQNFNEIKYMLSLKDNL